MDNLYRNITVKIMMLSGVFFLSISTSAFSVEVAPKSIDIPKRLEIPTKIKDPNMGCYGPGAVGYRKGPIRLGEIDLLVKKIAKSKGSPPDSLVAKPISNRAALKMVTKAGGNGLSSGPSKILLSALEDKDNSKSVHVKEAETDYLLVAYTEVFQKKLGLVIPGAVIDLSSGVAEGGLDKKWGILKGKNPFCPGCWAHTTQDCTACPESSDDELALEDLGGFPIEEVLPLPLKP